MVFAARLAEARGARRARPRARGPRGCSRRSAWRPTGALPPVADILAAFRLDKKFHGGVRFVLLEDVGRPVIVDDVPPDRARDGSSEEMGATR